MIERVLPYPSIGKIPNPTKLSAAQSFKYGVGRASSHLLSEIAGAVSSKASEKGIKQTQNSKPRRK